MKRNKINCILEKLDETSRMAITYIGAMDYETFKEDIRTQDAVMMRLVSIAQLVTQLTDYAPDFIADNSHIPWNMIRGMRNKIAHDYFSIDTEVLFETIRFSIPQLIDMITELLNKKQR